MKKCLGCDKDIPYQAKKTFCTHKCYVKSDKFKEDKEKREREADKERVDVTCLNCGNSWREKKSRKSKYCNSHCYREYMAKRFDRCVITKDEVGDFQNFDEFLTADELYCPIDGCSWFGKNLGFHVNMSHGITARDFKIMCGFNIGTGLVTKDVSQEIASRQHLAEAIKKASSLKPKKTPANTHGFKRDYLSEEGKEHRIKSKASNAPLSKNIICVECKKESKVRNGAKFCSRKCGIDFHNKKNRQKSLECACSYCNSLFLATKQQYKRNLEGMPVTCSIKCRNKFVAQKKNK